MTTKPLDLSLDNPIIMDTHSLLGASISAGHGVPNSSLDAPDDSINHQAHYAPTIFTINNTTSGTNNSITVPLESNLRPETRLQHQLHHLCRWNSCGQMFGEMEELVGHVNERHVVLDEGEYCCKWESCSRRGKGFNARYKMLIHVRTHTNEKPHQCPICGKSFSRLENLKIHNRSHTGERPYVCPVAGCNKRYSNSSDRFKHTRTHLEEKPYFCKVTGCDKRYTDPSSLRKHVKTFGHYASRDHLNHYITQKSSSAPLTKPTARISPTKSSPVTIFPSVTSVPPTSNVTGLPEGVIVYPILVHSPSLQPHYSYVTLPGHLTDFAGSTTSAISVAGLNNNDVAGEGQRSIKEEGFGLNQDSVSLSADIKS